MKIEEGQDYVDRGGQLWRNATKHDLKRFTLNDHMGIPWLFDEDGRMIGGQPVKDLIRVAIEDDFDAERARIAEASAWMPDVEDLTPSVEETAEAEAERLKQDAESLGVGGPSFTDAFMSFSEKLRDSVAKERLEQAAAGRAQLRIDFVLAALPAANLASLDSAVEVQRFAMNMFFLAEALVQQHEEHASTDIEKLNALVAEDAAK